MEAHFSKHKALLTVVSPELREVNDTEYELNNNEYSERTDKNKTTDVY